MLTQATCTPRVPSGASSSKRLSTSAGTRSPCCLSSSSATTTAPRLTGESQQGQKLSGRVDPVQGFAVLKLVVTRSYCGFVRQRRSVQLQALLQQDGAHYVLGGPGNFIMNETLQVRGRQGSPAARPCLPRGHQQQHAGCVSWSPVGKRPALIARASPLAPCNSPFNDGCIWSCMCQHPFV